MTTMGDDDQQHPHWSDQPSTAAERAAGEREAERPRSPLATLATRMADVSPAWSAVTLAADDAPAGSIDVGSRDRTIGVESIREGWLLHRGASRLAAAASPDLSLLVGDWCYAAGLCEITDHGSLDDVATLARLVADVSARAGESVDALDDRWSDATAEMASRVG